MDILKKLLTKSINTHYAVRYVKFIQWCSTKVRKPNEYLENHHILPCGKTQFPEYKSLSRNPWNSIKLTGREHFIAHWMLWKSQGGYMAYAFVSMCRKSKHQKNRYFVSSRSYEQAKIEAAKIQSTRFVSIETRQKMSRSQKNKDKLKCPHCSKIGDSLNMKRWHFDNCKIITEKSKHDNKSNQNIVTCPHCNKTGKIGGMYSNHFDNCPSIKDRSIKNKVTCPHCETEIANTKDKLRWHFDNCITLTGIKREQTIAHKNANIIRSLKTKGIKKETVTCSHCGKSGGKPAMTRFHFDNCKLNTNI